MQVTVRLYFARFDGRSERKIGSYYYLQLIIKANSFRRKIDTEAMMHDKKEATTEYAKMRLLIKKIVATNINAIHFVSHHLANNSYHSLHFYTRSEVFLRFYAIINLNLPSVLDKSPHSLGWIALVRHLDILLPTVL